MAAAPLPPTTPLSLVLVVPTDGSMCTFAVQTVVCGNIIGNNISNSVRIILYGASTLVWSTATAYIASISSLATALIISVVVFITVIAIILMRSKAKIKAASDLQLTNRAERTEPMYEDVTGPLPSVGAINTQDNVAYGHTQI